MKKALIAGALYAVPFLALAQTLVDAVRVVEKIINLVVPIMGALLIIWFFYGVTQYIGAGGDDEKRTAARNTMIYAVIGMFVAFSVFGLVGLLRRTFGVGQESTGHLPFFDDVNIPR